MEDKIKELLGVGLSNAVVAAAVGVTDSYVSQLLSQDSFRNAVQELRLKNLTEAAGRDRKWNGLEDRLLGKFEELLDFGAFTKAGDLLKAITVVNGAKRRSAPSDLPTTASATVVPLVLPIVIAPKLQINETGQVIEVNGRPIATMPAKIVNEKLDELRGRTEENKQIKDDAEKARARLATLQRLNALPVNELI